MNQFMKRSIAVLIALVLVISLVPSSVFTASAATYTYNWGTRGVLATELSDSAEAWYAKYNVTYDSLSSLSGSSSTSSVPSSALYTELKSLMTTAHTTITSYSGTTDLFQYTDCQNGGGQISSFYSGAAIGPAWDSGSTWNREHTWPNSKGLDGSDEDDIMMLRPTSVSENSSRGNTAYGESSGFYDPNIASYDVHGDVARIMLYVYVRWGNTEYMWGSSGVIESKEVLLKWMEEDPVDTWELGRNDSVQSITGTRNVFVDYPELAFILFDEEIPDGYDSPSGSGAGASYTITAQPNDAIYGTVSLSGNTITASPNNGYIVSGYEVLSGTATVTQNGDVFTVSASSDCTIQINFAPKTLVTVNFSGASVAAQTGYAGDTMSLPTVEDPEGFTFLGWMDAPLSDETTEKPSYYTDSFTPTGNTTLYALYSYVDTTSGDSGSGDYVKVTSAPDDWSGDYVIVYEAGSVIFDGELTALDTTSNTQSVTITNNTIAKDAADPYKFTIAVTDGGYSIQSASGYYIGATSNSNSLNSSTTTAYANTISLDADGNTNIVSSGGAYLRYNASSGQNRFRYYKSSSYTGQQPVALYRKDGSSGTTYYVSTICDHANTTEVAAVAATCTENGYTAGVFCKDCQTFISGHEVVEATGHSMDEGKITTAATCTEDGIKTYTCTACGETKTEVVPATGHNYVADGNTYTCSNCGDSYTKAANRYYIAAIRSTGNYFYMTNSLGTANTQRYQAEDSGLTTLPDTITDPEDDKVFVLVDNGDGTYCIYAEGLTGDNYLGWSSGNSGTFVAEESAKLLVKETNGDGTCCFYFNDGTDNRYLSLNSSSSNNYFAWYKTGQVQNLVLIPIEEETNPIVKWNITLEDNLKVNFYLDLNEGDQVYITVGTAEVTCDLSDLTKSDDGKYYIATVSMAAAQMTDEIAVQVINGEDVLADKTYSIRGYADIILGSDDFTEETKTLVREMLNYGGMAQKFFGYNTDNLANDGIEGVGETPVPNDGFAEMTHTDPDDGCITFYGASLVYRDKIAVRYYFDITNTEGLIFTADGNECEAVLIGGHYMIEVPNICPQDYEKQIEVIVTNAEGCSATVSYGPMNYIVRMYYKEGATQETQDILLALYNYHLAAVAYLAENS